MTFSIFHKSTATSTYPTTLTSVREESFPISRNPSPLMDSTEFFAKSPLTVTSPWSGILSMTPAVRTLHNISMG